MRTTYRYLARDEEGKKAVGTIAAETEREAETLLASEGLNLIRIKSGESMWSSDVIGGHVKREHMVAAMWAIASTVQARIALPTAVAFAAKEATDPKLKRGLDAIATDLLAGVDIGDAFAGPGIFPEAVVDAIRAGDEASKIGEALDYAVSYLERGDELRAKMTKALAEPLFNALVGGIACAFIIMFAIPKMVNGFKDLGGPGYQLPHATRVMLAFSKVSPFVFGIIALIGVVGWLYYRSHKHDSRLRMAVDTVILHLPGIGRFLLLESLASVSRTLSMLMSVSVSPNRSLELAANSARLAPVEAAFREARDAVDDGDDISTALVDNPVIPGLYTQLVIAGEQSHKVADMFGRIAHKYERDLDLAGDRLARNLGRWLGIGVTIVISVIGLLTLLPIAHIGDVMDASTGW